MDSKKRGIAQIEPVDLERKSRNSDQIIVAGKVRPLNRSERRRRQVGPWQR